MRSNSASVPCRRYFAGTSVNHLDSRKGVSAWTRKSLLSYVIRFGKIIALFWKASIISRIPRNVKLQQSIHRCVTGRS